jgi:hypothetical protein
MEARKFIKIKKGCVIPNAVHLNFISIEKVKFFYWLLPFEKEGKFGLTIQAFQHDEKRNASNMVRKQLFFVSVKSLISDMEKLILQQLKNGYGHDKRFIK